MNKHPTIRAYGKLQKLRDYDITDQEFKKNAMHNVGKAISCKKHQRRWYIQDKTCSEEHLEN